MLTVRHKIDVFLRSGHTVRVEAKEYEFERAENQSYCAYRFRDILNFCSFSIQDIVGFKVVGKSYRLK